jgi:uncharacterized protein
MQISLHPLNQVKEGCFRLQETVLMDSICEEVSTLIRVEPVAVTVHVTRLEPHLLAVAGEQSTLATFSCARCLTQFTLPLITRWSERFTDVKQKAQTKEEQEIHFVAGNMIDLDPYIREALLLQLPFVPVCREECQGLCPTCGSNRNSASCDCEQQLLDPRLLRLQTWREEA